MNYAYYSLIHKENKEVELLCCIDLDTIDDDEPVSEYCQNDGRWAIARPDYCKIDGVNCDCELNELKEIEVYEWDWISQALVDVVEESYDEVFVREFDKATLYMSYDRDFDSETAKKLPSGKTIINDYHIDQVEYQGKLWAVIDYENDIYEQFIDSEELESEELADLERVANGELSIQEFSDKYGYEWNC